MKAKWTSALFATTTLAALAALAGTVGAQTPATPVPAAASPAALAPAQPLFDPNQLPATDGTVAHFTLTPRGDVDGFLLADGTQVHFPPHMSAQLVAAVKPGDGVTVHGLRAAAIPMVAAMSITGKARGKTVVDMGPPGPRGGPGRGPEGGPGGPGHRGPPPPPAAGPAAEASGKVLASLHGPRGELNGAMLEDGTTLRLPPPEAARLASLLASGQTVVADGPGIANDLGRMIDVRAIGPSKGQLTEVQAPPPHGPRGPDGDRRGPPPRP